MPRSPFNSAEAEGPIVVFVDLGTMLSFDQLASALRARGVRVIHLTTGHNFLAKVSSRVLYHETHLIGGVQDLSAALARVDTSAVVDVQCPEAMLADVLRAAESAGLPDHVLAALRARQCGADKLEVSRRLRAHGVPVPRAVEISDADDRDLVAELGLPVVLKCRIGSGGEGVRVVAEEGKVHATIQELGGVATGLYAEEYQPGETLCFAAVHADGVALEQACYRTLQARPGEGPSSTIQVIEDPELAKIGLDVVGMLPGVGMVNLDVVQDADGHPQVVDVNLRAWHSIVALAAAGHDFPSAYLKALGMDFVPLGDRAADVATGEDHLVHVFPDQSPRFSDRRQAMRRFLRDLCSQRSVLPARYIAVQVPLFLRRLV